MARYIFVTGGVVSSLGKGLSSASLAYLLKSQGFKVRVRKMDPYLNVDPGTMSPFQHGEVFVTDDGAETDLDLGHYERFTNIPSTKNDITNEDFVICEIGGTVGDIESLPFLEAIRQLSNDLGRGRTLFIVCSLGLTIISRGDLEPTSSVFDKIEENKDDTPLIPENNN